MWMPWVWIMPVEYSAALVASLACLGKKCELRRGCGPRDLTVTHSGVPTSWLMRSTLFRGAVQKSSNAQSGALSKCCFIVLFKSLISSLEKEFLKNPYHRNSLYKLPLAYHCNGFSKIHLLHVTTSLKNSQRENWIKGDIWLLFEDNYFLCMGKNLGQNRTSKIKE